MNFRKKLLVVAGVCVLSATSSRVAGHTSYEGYRLLLESAAAAKRNGDFVGLRNVTNPVTIHIVAHTHDDVGWLKTVDQYFTGAKNSIQNAGVNYVLSTAIDALVDNPGRTFTYIEQAFFSRWWAEQTPAKQSIVRTLVEAGQLVFANGGYCMHDEEGPDWLSMVDQTALGHRLIVDAFGTAALPNVTWQIDPFGHSSMQQQLSSPSAGFGGVTTARIDIQDFAERLLTRRLEWVWQTSPSLGATSQALYHELPMTYGAPPELGWDITDSDARPIVDDPALYDNNVNVTIDWMLLVAEAFHVIYGGDDVMILFGDDFQYSSAHAYFINLDKLIKWGNIIGEPLGFNFVYSSPGRYMTAKAAHPPKPFPLRTDDVFPYADGLHSMWSGYFTSRPALKGYIRDTTSIFAAARQLQLQDAKTPLPPVASSPLLILEQALSITQHHDAVAGTSKQQVAYDYAKRLAAGREAGDVVMGGALAGLTGYAAAPFVRCDLTNVTICRPLELGIAHVLVLYNSQSTGKASLPVRLPVAIIPGVSASWVVLNSTSGRVLSQLLPLTSADAHLRYGYYDYSGDTANGNVSVQWLAFMAADIPAQGFATYFLQPSPSAKEFSAEVSYETSAPASNASITNGILTLTIDPATGLLSSITNAVTGLSVDVTQELLWYKPVQDSHEQNSGAYIFRPNGSSPFAVSATGAVATVVFGGSVVQEIRQTFGTWAAQTLRLWAGSAEVEVEWTLGPVDVSDHVGKEVISRYTLGAVSTTQLPWNSNETWATDDNCREWQTRRLNKRSYAYIPFEPVAGNYAPVSCSIRSVDTASGATLTLATDRTQGGGSLGSASVEVMLHRRLLYDDGRGVGDPLNETGLDGRGLIARGVHRISMDASAPAAARWQRGAQSDSMMHPLVFLAPLTGLTPTQYGSSFVTARSGLTSSLPPNLAVVTWHAYNATTALLRLAHMFEVGEDPALSLPATVGIASLFTDWTITGAVEMTLPGSQPLAMAPQWTYHVEGQQPNTLPVVPPAPAGVGLEVTLSAMQIRTFVVQIIPSALR